MRAHTAQASTGQRKCTQDLPVNGRQSGRIFQSGGFTTLMQVEINKFLEKRQITAAESKSIKLLKTTYKIRFFMFKVVYADTFDSSSFGCSSVMIPELA